MSKKGAKASEKEQDEQLDDSVYDFLYCDTPRIGSFLSQFDPSGHLTGITQSESIKVGTRRGFRFAAGGGATHLGTGGNANLAFEKAPTDEGMEGAQRAYNPNWANALNLMDLLQERNLIKGVENASLGQFVLLSGSITIIDTSLLKTIFEKPALRKQMLLLNQVEEAPAPKHGRRSEREKPSHPMEIGFELMTVFNPTAQLTMADGDLLAWAGLTPLWLTVTSGDLILQHGVSIPGTWHLLALLDSKPDDQSELPTEVDPRLAPMASGLAGMLPSMRQILGRPPAAYGVTPLLVFREVAS